MRTLNQIKTLNKPVVKTADWVNALPESEIRRLLRFNPKYYFAGGKPGVLPVKCFHQIIQEIIAEEDMFLDNESEHALDNYNYGMTEGNQKFREVLAKRLKTRDRVRCTADNLVITTGSQQILYAINDALIRPGDIILTTRPTYLGFLMPAQKMGAKVVTLPSDEKGLQPEYIERAIDSCKREFGKVPKILYVIPCSDNPGGTTLTDKRKQQIADAIFEKYDILIIEDVAYKEIRFDDKPFRGIKEKDEDNKYVAYLSTTTKEAASFRAGYSVLPNFLREAVVKGKGYYDLCTSEWVQKILTIYYEKYIDIQLPAIRNGYRARRNAMVSALDDYLAYGEYNTPEGGFFVWYKHKKEDFDAKKHLTYAIMEGVSYVPGESFYPINGHAITDDSKLVPCKIPRDSMRLGYSLLSPEMIREGIEQLSRINL